MKSALRSLKNEFYDYNDGERLARQLTSNNDDAPLVSQLKKLVECVNTYTLAEYKKIFLILMRRVTDYRYLKHMEKGLLVVEYLMKYADHRFLRSCKINVKHFRKLKTFTFTLYGRDYGENVRRRSTRIVMYLEDDYKMELARKKYQGEGYKMRTTKPKTDAPKAPAPVPPKKSKKKSSSKKHSSTSSSSSVDSTENLKPSAAKKSKKKKSKSSSGTSDGSETLSGRDLAAASTASTSGTSATAEGAASPAPKEEDFLSDLLGGPAGGLTGASAAGPTSTADELNDEEFFNEFAFVAGGFDEDPFFDGSGPAAMEFEGAGGGAADGGAVFGFGAAVEDDFTDDWMVTEDGDPADEETDAVDAWMSELTTLSSKDPLGYTTSKPGMTKATTSKGTGMSMKEMAKKDGGVLPAGYDDSFLSFSMMGGPGGSAPSSTTAATVASAAHGGAHSGPITAEALFGPAPTGGYGPVVSQQPQPSPVMSSLYGAAPVAAPDPFADMFGSSKTQAVPSVHTGPVPATYKKSPRGEKDPFADLGVF